MPLFAPSTPARPSVAEGFVLDACILMSGVLRPALLDFADLGWFQPIWSERIGEEWRRNAHRIWGVEPTVLDAEWELMQQRCPGAHTGDITPYLQGLRESDPKDWHVIAAGLAARARWPGAALQCAVLTWNLKDFRRAELRRLGLTLIDPDRLLVQWWQRDPDTVEAVLNRTLTDLASAGRPRSPVFVEALRRERLFRLARLMTQRQSSDTSCLGSRLAS